MDKSNSKMYIDKIKMYINKYGDKIYKNSKGLFHREDGPAIEWKDGSNFWYKEGKGHKIDGPACEYSDGNKYWYILDKELEEKEFNSWISRIKTYI